MICPNCNEVVGESQAFCGNCGTPLVQAQPQADQSTTVESHDATVPVGNAYQQPADAAAETVPNPPYSAQQPPYGSSQQTQQGAYSAPYAPQGTGYGQAPFPPGGYAYQGQQAQTVSNVPFGLSIAALVCTLIGLFPVGLVLAIVALVMNSNQKKSGVTSTRQTPTFVMSVISIVLSALLTVLLIVFGAALVAAVNNGALDNVEINPSGQVTVTAPSGTSATSATNANSSSSSAASAASNGSSAGAAGTFGAGSASSTASSFTGTWEIDSIESSNGDNLGSAELDDMRDLGLNVELVINDDGTASLSLFGESITKGSWTQAGNGTINVVFEGETIPVKLEGNLLVLEDGSDKLVFHRAE